MKKTLVSCQVQQLLREEELIEKRLSFLKIDGCVDDISMDDLLKGVKIIEPLSFSEWLDSTSRYHKNFRTGLKVLIDQRLHGANLGNLVSVKYLARLMDQLLLCLR